MSIFYTHHISNPGDFNPLLRPLVSTPEDLESFLTLCSDGLSTFGSSSKYRSKNQVLLTYDDGFRSVLDKALPLHEKFEVPFHLFITTSFIDGRRVPYEIRLANLITDNQEIVDPHSGVLHSVVDISAKWNLYEKYRKMMKSYEPRFQDELIHQIEKTNNSRNSVKKNYFLDWDDILDLSEHELVKIGSHASSHAYLTALSLREIYRELSESKKKIEKIVKEEITSISYPYGAVSLAVQIAAVVAGYRLGYGTETPRRIKNPVVTRLSIPRTDLSTGIDTLQRGKSRIV